MPRKSKAQPSSIQHTAKPVLPADSKALDQMYQQSRFEAQCWFFTSLIIAIIGTVFVLGTILLFILFKDLAPLNSSGKLTLTIANVVIGITQHLIIAQTRAANKRADNYARALNQEANELHINEIIQVIISSFPAGEERNNLLVQTIMDALTHLPHETQSPLPVPGLAQIKPAQKRHKH